MASPDGQSIAYEIEGAGRRSSLYVMSITGTERRRLVDRRFAGYASWSPDGTELAYVAGGASGPSWEIYVVNVESLQTRRLTDNPVTEVEPQWSPDGRRIAFSRDQVPQGHGADIYVISSDGGSEEKLTEGGDRRSDSGAVWAPDGSRLAFVRTTAPPSIHLVDLSGAETRIASTPARSLEHPAPVWSPDGRSLAYVGGAIFIVDTREEAIRIRVDLPEDESVPAADRMPVAAGGPLWSPDGNTVLFATAPLSIAFGDVAPIGIYLTNADGSAPRKVMTIEGRHAAVTDWI